MPVLPPNPLLGPISGPIVWALPVWADSMHINLISLSLSLSRGGKKIIKNTIIYMLLRKSIECCRGIALRVGVVEVET